MQWNLSQCSISLFLLAAALLLLCPAPSRAEDDAALRETEKALAESEIESIPPMCWWCDGKKALENVIGPLELGLVLTGFFDWHDNADVGGVRYPSLDGTGGVVQFTFDWNPIETGRLLGEFRYGMGKGATGTMLDDEATLGVVNQLSTDMTSNHVQVFALYWDQQFLDGNLFVDVGKNEPEAYIDQNEYANDEFTQFVDQALVNDPVLDNEDEQMPMVAVGGNINERFNIQGVALASTQDGAKGEFDQPLETPFLGVQVAYDATILGQDGTYRLTGFSATYEHEKLSGSGKSPGFGAGVSFNQSLTEKIGVFGRAYWHNEDVYEINWALSGGVSATGLVPSRENDVLGLGCAFLVTDTIANTGGTESHFEAYYRVNIRDTLYLTPDIRYVASPKGLASNGDILTAMLSLQLDF